MEKKVEDDRLNRMPQLDDLQKQIKKQTRRIEDAKNRRANIFSQTVYIGTLGLLFVLPLIGGAYLGLWLDSLADGYSVRWTMGFIVAGLICGALNVYLFLRE